MKSNILPHDGGIQQQNAREISFLQRRNLRNDLHTPPVIQYENYGSVRTVYESVQDAASSTKAVSSC